MKVAQSEARLWERWEKAARFLASRRAKAMTPTCRELIRLWNEREDVETETGGFADPDAIIIDRVGKVLALHRSSDTGLPPSAIRRCADCKQEWPCPTVRLLNGEKP